jgi:Immunoglobulin I-set domain
MEQNSDLNLAGAGRGGIFPDAGRKWFFEKHRAFAAARFGGKPGRGRSKVWWRLAVFCGLLALVPRAPAAPLMEEGFDYPAGTALAANPPWSGVTGPSVSVVSGNLSLTNLQATAPAGNMLQIGGGGSVFAYRNFSDSPVASAEGVAVYCSALVHCTLPPTNRQFIACLLPAGATSANAPNDPVDLYVTTGSGGCRLAIRSEGSDAATASTVLTTNTTHLIVIKYTFGSNDFASLYVDPVPGAPEPAFASAQTGGDGGGEDDDGGGGDAANLQVLLFQSPDTAAEGGIDFDTARVGTNWADVTPKILPVSVSGPQDQAVCSGSPAVFSVTANGTPPFTYQWRTNGLPAGGATNDFYLLPSPGAADTSVAYDVVVHDFFGSVTSRVASLLISYGPPAIPLPPTNQVILPGVSNAVFSVGAAGDAPLSYQWFTNGTPVPGATNAGYTVTNPGPADATNPIVVVVSNPCGSITSAPPVTVKFPTVFYAAADAGAGFFGGENVIFTNTSGLGYYAWSSSDPSVSVTNWTMEGPLSELPLGTSGNSRYGINLNPQTSPVYYIFAQSNLGPYPPTEWVTWLTTPDFASFYVNSAEVPITADGFLEFSAPPKITRQPANQTVMSGQNASFSVTAVGFQLGYLWQSNNAAIAGASDATFRLTNVSTADAGAYAVIVTNASGAVTSSVATLTVTLPPTFRVNLLASGTIQVNVNSASGVAYIVESATNLDNPVWTPMLTNTTGGAGALNVNTAAPGAGQQYYRLVFP